MKRIIVALTALFFFQAAYSQSYQPVDAQSSVTVLIRNLGMEIDGKLSGLDGSIFFNPGNLKSASFSVRVNANSINTGIDVRDSALKGIEYLDAVSFPAISFVSRQILQPNKTGPFTMKGILTIKGISKEISFPFTATPKEGGLLFSGEMHVNRLDFKIATTSTVLSNGMTVRLSVFAKTS